MCSFLAMRALRGHGLPLDEAGHVEIDEVVMGLGLQELAEHDDATAWAGRAEVADERHEP